MTPSSLLSLLPFLAIAGAIVVVMLAIAFYRRHRFIAGLTLLALALAFASLFVVPSAGSRQVTPLLIVDDYALFFLGLIFGASFVVAVLAYGYLKGRAGEHEELYLLLLLATLGSMTLIASSHFASFFLGLETLSVSLYVLIAYPRVRLESIEAGLKYLVLAAASSAFLLFGMALVYAETGTMELARLVSLPSSPAGHSALVMAGFALIVVGIGFKLAVVPFHLWTPDIYQGAPAPVTAFVASVSKGAVFALLLRYFTRVDIHSYGSLFLVFVIIAVASMLVGNLLALLQNNVKRILAYSSIAHLGYLLVAFLAAGNLRVTAVSFYLVAYFITTLGAFGVVGALSTPDREAESMEDYRGLFWRRPWLAAVFTAMLLSLAGMPLTAGFIGKFYLVTAGVGSALWLLVVVLVVSSSIGLFYYLRVASAMLQREPAAEVAPAPPLSLSSGATLVLAVLTLLLVWLGVYPTPLINLIQLSTTGPF